MRRNQTMLAITEEQRSELSKWAQSRTLPAGDVFRARLRTPYGEAANLLCDSGSGAFIPAAQTPFPSAEHRSRTRLISSRALATSSLAACDTVLPLSGRRLEVQQQPSVILLFRRPNHGHENDRCHARNHCRRGNHRGERRHNIGAAPTTCHLPFRSAPMS